MGLLMNTQGLNPGTKVRVANSLKEWESDRAMCGKVATIRSRNFSNEKGTSYNVDLEGNDGEWDLWSGDIATVLPSDSTAKPE